MYGYGSGRRHDAKTTVESCRALDIRVLHRRKILQRDASHAGVVLVGMELHMEADPHPRQLQAAPAEARALQVGVRPLGHCQFSRVGWVADRSVLTRCRIPCPQTTCLPRSRWLSASASLLEASL